MKKVLVLILGIMLGLGGLMLGGCGDPYANIVLTPLASQLTLEVGEQVELSVRVDGIEASVSSSLTFSRESEKISLSAPTQNQNVSTVTVTGLAVCETNIVVTMNETARSITIPVRVVERISSFYKTSSENELVVKEDGFSLDLSPTRIFTFVPASATQTALNYYYTSGNETSLIREVVYRDGAEGEGVYLVRDDGSTIRLSDNTTSFTLSAVSVSNPDLQAVAFTVDIKESIALELDDLTFAYVEAELDDLTDADYEAIPAEGITLISNDPAKALVAFKLSTTQDIVFDIDTQNIVGDLETTDEGVANTPSFRRNLSFTVQAYVAGEDTLVVRASYPGYSSYDKEISLPLSVVTAPSSLRINGYDQSYYLSADGSRQNEIVLYDIIYSGAQENRLDIAVYWTNASFESVVMSVVTGAGDGTYTDVSFDGWSSSLNIYYGNTQMTQDTLSISSNNFTNNVLTGMIRLYGRSANDSYFLKFEVESQYIPEGESVEYYLPISIKEGASTFEVIYPTDQDRIYIDLEDGAIDFGTQGINNDVYLKILTQSGAEAYVGTMRFVYLNSSNEIFTITQPNAGDKTVTITPLAEGSGSVMIYLPNGRTQTLTVEVVKSYDGSAQLNVLNSDYVHSYSFDQAQAEGNLILRHDSLSSGNPTLLYFVTQNGSTQFEVTHDVDGQNDYLSLAVASESGFGTGYFLTTLDKTTKAQDITFTITGKMVESFSLVKQEEDTITLNYEIYVPIERIELYEGLRYDSSISVISLYNASTATGAVGAYYGLNENTSYAKATFFPVITFADGESFVVKAIDQTTLEATSVYSLDGTEVDQDEFNDYRLDFSSIIWRAINDVDGSNILWGEDTSRDSGTTTAGIDWSKDGLIGLVLTREQDATTILQETFSFQITQRDQTYIGSSIVVLESIVRPSSTIGVSRYNEFLDSDGTLAVHLDSLTPEITLDCVISPSNATALFREFDLVFTPDGASSNVVAITHVSNDPFSPDYLKINLSSSGIGGSGTLTLIPKVHQDYSGNRLDDTTYTSIYITVADGTRENPVYISSAEEFVSLFSSSNPQATQNLSRHYKITTTLDFGGMRLETFGSFSGSIIGEGPGAGLINLNINSSRAVASSRHTGLFATISSGAEIKDLFFRGSLELTLSQNFINYIGFVAGRNYGTLENLSVELENFSVDYSSSPNGETAYVGGVVGENRGTISHTGQILFRANAFEITNAAGRAEALYAGGVAGSNSGTVSRTDDGNVYFNEGDFTVSSFVSLSNTGLTSFGAVAGTNSGSLTNLKASGRIGGATNTGGLAGSMTAGSITGSTARVRVSATEAAGGLVGSLTGGIVESNIVQATVLTQEDRTTPFIVATNSSSANAFAGEGTAGANQAYYYYQNFDTNDIETFINLIQYLNDTDETSVKTEYKQGDFVFEASPIGAVTIASDNKVNSVAGAEIANTAYLEYYEASDSSLQSKLTSLNTVVLPFSVENSADLQYSITSGSSIASFSGQNLILSGTGTVVITIRSLLDFEATKIVTICVVHACDSFALYYNGTRLTSGSILTIPPSSLSSSGRELTFTYEHTGVPAKDDNGLDMTVSLVRADYSEVGYEITKTVTGDSGNLEIEEEPAADDDKWFELTFYSNKITIRPTSNVNKSAIYQITFTPKFDIAVGETTVTPAKEISPDGLDLNLSVQRGTTKLEFSSDSLIVEPLDDFSLKVTQYTDYANDNLTVSFVDSTTGAKLEDLYTLTLCSKYIFKDETDDFKDETDDKIKYIEYTYSFTFNSAFLNKDIYDKVIYINFTSTSSDYVGSIMLTIERQGVNAIYLKNYYDINANKNYMTNLDAQKDVVTPNYPNLLEIEVYPSYAEYDHILIENQNSNLSNDLIFEVVRIGADGSLEAVSGAENTERGIIIPKSVIADEGKLYVRYVVTTQAQDLSYSRFRVSAMLDGREVAFNSRTIQVKVAEGVVVKLAEEYTHNGEIYVASGLTYDLDVSFIGYTESEASITVDSQYARLNRTQNGYTLTVSSNISYSNGSPTITITSFGRRTVNGLTTTSAINTYEIKIVEFLILEENLSNFSVDTADSTFENANPTGLSTVIDGENDGVVDVAIGNLQTLEVSLINGVTVLYDDTSVQKVQMLENIERALSTGGTWSIACESENWVGRAVTAGTITNSNKNEILMITQQNGLSQITPIYVNTETDFSYYFSYEASFDYVSGVPVIWTDATALGTDFKINAYQRGAEDNEIPILTEQDLLNMQPEAYYILQNDITLSNDFTTLTTDIAGLNGNGYTITLPSMWTLSGANAGLFESIGENTTIRNLNVAFSSSTSITLSNSDSTTYFGVLAGRNDGIVTNCEILGGEYNLINVRSSNQASTKYVAGMVGYNGGYITNSSVSINLHILDGHLAGFVGLNAGYVASSKVEKSSLTHEGTTSSSTVAGFVSSNGSTSTTSGQIITSYVTGGTDYSAIYSTDASFSINASSICSGFVLYNYGDISDSYSNIPLYSRSRRAGFAYASRGDISRCYSTSTFEEQQGESDSGFIYTNRIEDVSGSLENNFYLAGVKNSGISPNSFASSQVRALSENEFANSTTFDSFAFSSDLEKTKGVWFMPAHDGYESDFVRDGETMRFTVGRPELVAPNIKASSRRVLVGEDTETGESGETIYVYREEAEAQGAKYNPYIVTSVAQFESLVLENSRSGADSSYYRIVKTLDYVEEGITLGGLYNVIFQGDIEGNGMSITGYTLDTREYLYSAGYFSRVGNGNSYAGAIKNLTFAPRYLNTPNAVCLGTVAGILDAGLLFNVTVDGYSYNTSGITLVGQNLVGGVVGVARGRFKMYNVTSSVSASSTYRSSNLASYEVYDASRGYYDNISYAGAIVGLTQVDGNQYTGEIKNASVTGGVRSLGENVGLFIGRVGARTEVTNIHYTFSTGQFVTAMRYAGVIAGENCGTIRDCSVSGNLNSFFTFVPTTPNALGGAVGFARANSLIENVSVNASLEFSNISMVGGIVGELIGGEIADSSFEGSIRAFSMAGGLVARVGDSLSTKDSVSGNSATISSSSVASATVAVEAENYYRSYVGGLVGADYNSTNLSHTYSDISVSDIDISVTNYIYNGNLNAYISYFIGASFVSSGEEESGSVTITATNPNTLLVSGDSSLTVTVHDYRTAGVLNLYYGPLVGFGSLSDASSTFSEEINFEGNLFNADGQGVSLRINYGQNHNVESRTNSHSNMTLMYEEQADTTN